MTLKPRPVTGGIGGATDQPRKMGRLLKQSTRGVPRRAKKGKHSWGSLCPATRSREVTPYLGLRLVSHTSERFSAGVQSAPNLDWDFCFVFPTTGNWIKNRRVLLSSKPSGEEQIPISCTTIATIRPLPVFEMRVSLRITTCLPPWSQVGCSKG